MFRYGSHVGRIGVAKTYLPFLILAGLTVYFVPGKLLIIAAYLPTAAFFIAALHLADLAQRRYDARSDDADSLMLHGPPPYCWSSIGPPASVLASTSRPQDFLVLSGESVREP
jgi:hypothetical protein